jgi:DNA repair protein RadC
MTYQIISERKLRSTVNIQDPAGVFELVKRYAKEKQELIILVTLNGAHNVISVSIVSIGLANKALIHPREVFCKAICDRATAIIICHNHPSGEVSPSDEDKKFTEEIAKAGLIIGIPLIDHIVFSKSDYTSLLQQDIFPETCNLD